MLTWPLVRWEQVLITNFKLVWTPLPVKATTSGELVGMSSSWLATILCYGRKSDSEWAGNAPVSELKVALARNHPAIRVGRKSEIYGCWRAANANGGSFSVCVCRKFRVISSGSTGRDDELSFSLSGKVVSTSFGERDGEVGAFFGEVTVGSTWAQWEWKMKDFRGKGGTWNSSGINCVRHFLRIFLKMGLFRCKIKKKNLNALKPFTKKTKTQTSWMQSSSYLNGGYVIPFSTNYRTRLLKKLNVLKKSHF